VRARGDNGSDPAATTYPGQDLGLPRDGAGSVAPTSRRLLAFFADWLLCSVITAAFIHAPVGTPLFWSQLRDWTIVVFAVQDFMLTGMLGATIGKRLLRIRVIRLDGGAIGPGWALLRTALLLIVLPAVLQDRDLRGMHDRAANAVVVVM